MLLRTVAGSIAGGVSDEPRRNGVAGGTGAVGKVEEVAAGADGVEPGLSNGLEVRVAPVVVGCSWRIAEAGAEDPNWRRFAADLSGRNRK
jgi:hypothetical protein